MNSITLRKASPSDAPGILECLRLAFAPYRSRYTADAFRDTVLTEESIQQRLSAMTVFVACKEASVIVGTIAASVVDVHEGHLRGMAVLPAQQSRGTADALLELAEAELASSGCSRVTLDTTEPLERAMRFYERHGYRRSGRVTDFFGMPLHEYVKHLSH